MWSSSSIVRSSMGQKTHPIGFRLGVIKPWKSRWYAESDFGKLLQEDETIRRYLSRRLSHASVADVEIDRKPQKIVVTIQTARPGDVIGKQGEEGRAEEHTSQLQSHDHLVCRLLF